MMGMALTAEQTYLAVVHISVGLRVREGGGREGEVGGVSETVSAISTQQKSIK